MIDIQLPNDAKQQHESENDIKYIEAYKAAMVSLMKRKKSMDFKHVGNHYKYVNGQFQREIMEKMKKWNITEDDFRSCLDTLIENDYIERKGNTLQYV